MKRLITSAAVLLIAAQMAVAGFNIGPRIGLNFANVSDKNVDYDMRVGFQGGLQAEFTLLNIIGVQSGVLYTTKGAKMDLLGVESSLKPSYLEVPVNGVFKLNLIVADIVFLTGPYFAWGIGGTTTAEVLGKEVTSDIEWGDGIGQQKRFDFGWNFGAGVGLLGLQVTAQYGLGITNMSNVDKLKATNSVFSLAAAYMF